MTPEELHRRVFDFRLAAAVFAGIELGLFELLAGDGLEEAVLADRSGCEARALGVWLRALEAAGIVERDGARVRVEPALRASLDPASASYLGHLFLHDLWHWTRWAGLADTLRSGEPSRDYAGDRHLSDPEVIRRFLPNYNEAMRESAGEAPERIALAVAKEGPRRVVDFGGGNGDTLIAVCRLLPAARGVLVERGFALACAEARIEAAGLDARIERIDADIEVDPLPAGYDAAILSRVLMGFAPERAAALVARVARGLVPGGTLFVHDFAATSGPGAWLGLDMLLNTGGEVHSGESIRAWMRACGLEDVHEQPLLAHTRLWTGRQRS